MGRVSHLHTPLVSQNRLKRKINPGKHDVYWEFRMYVSFVVCETCAIFLFYLKLSWWRNLGSDCFGTNFTDLKIMQSSHWINYLLIILPEKSFCFLTGNLNNIWRLNNICAHFITNPNTHYFFPCIMNSFWILFSEYPNVVQEFYSAILLFKLVVRISMGQCDVFVSEWCYILVVWNCEHERWEMTSYQPCEVKVCTTIFNFKFWM